MRHNKKINHLGRKSAHRKAMLSNMAASLIMHKRIVTTLAKAKALRMYVEPLITKSKDDSTNSRRTVFSFLQNKEAVTVLFREIAQKVAERPGGYTRILKTGTRLGDSAEMCIIELVDFNEALLKDKDTKKAKTTRRSKRKKSDEVETPSKVKVEKKKAEEVVTEKAEPEKEQLDEKVEDSNESEENESSKADTEEENK
ncbi:MAG: 50S ribosomal protein L17 [Bacteroidales bacterium]|nr:50S ribosomal protein L17 [Bacteroidales bacterium]